MFVTKRLSTENNIQGFKLAEWEYFWHLKAVNVGFPISLAISVIVHYRCWLSTKHHQHAHIVTVFTLHLSTSAHRNDTFFILTTCLSACKQLLNTANPWNRDIYLYDIFSTVKMSTCLIVHYWIRGMWRLICFLEDNITVNDISADGVGK